MMSQISAVTVLKAKTILPKATAPHASYVFLVVLLFLLCFIPSILLILINIIDITIAIPIICIIYSSNSSSSSIGISWVNIRSMQ